MGFDEAWHDILLQLTPVQFDEYRIEPAALVCTPVGPLSAYKPAPSRRARCSCELLHLLPLELEQKWRVGLLDVDLQPWMGSNALASSTSLRAAISGPAYGFTNVRVIRFLQTDQATKKAVLRSQAARWWATVHLLRRWLK